MATDPDLIVFNDHLVVKFYQTLKAASIVNSAFSLSTNGATPALVANPFQAINIQTDYDSISRELSLWFDTPIADSSPYRLTSRGLVDVAGRAVPTNTYDFTSGATTGYNITPPVPEATRVEDHSILTKPFVVSNEITAVNPDFYIVDTDPNLDSVILSDNNYSEGRVTIKFSAPPANKYINGMHFKAQRKQISRNVALWQSIAVTITKDTVLPWVYIQFPLTQDATPVYFNDNYKYRIKISKDVGTS